MKQAKLQYQHLVVELFASEGINRPAKRSNYCIIKQPKTDLLCGTVTFKKQRGQFI